MVVISHIDLGILHPAPQKHPFFYFLLYYSFVYSFKLPRYRPRFAHSFLIHFIIHLTRSFSAFFILLEDLIFLCLKNGPTFMQIRIHMFRNCFFTSQFYGILWDTVLPTNPFIYVFPSDEDQCKTLA